MSLRKIYITSILVVGSCLFGILHIVKIRISEAKKTASVDQVLALKESYLFFLRYREDYEKSIKDACEISGVEINLPKFEVININTATKVELENAIDKENDRVREVRNYYSKQTRLNLLKIQNNQ